MNEGRGEQKEGKTRAQSRYLLFVSLWAFSILVFTLYSEFLLEILSLCVFLICVSHSFVLSGIHSVDDTELTLCTWKKLTTIPKAHFSKKHLIAKLANLPCVH